MYCVWKQCQTQQVCAAKIECPRALTAQLSPRNSPAMPSFLNTVVMPWMTPRYSRGASCFALSSPCNCNLISFQCSPFGGLHSRWLYRILIVSKLCVTVTAPQAAMPPAMKELQDQCQRGESYGALETRQTQGWLTCWYTVADSTCTALIVRLLTVTVLCFCCREDRWSLCCSMVNDMR